MHSALQNILIIIIVTETVLCISPFKNMKKIILWVYHFVREQFKTLHWCSFVLNCTACLMFTVSWFPKIRITAELNHQLEKLIWSHCCRGSDSCLHAEKPTLVYSVQSILKQSLNAMMVCLMFWTTADSFSFMGRHESFPQSEIMFRYSRLSQVF